MSEPRIGIPPYTIEDTYSALDARAFAETIPEHVDLKNGVELRELFDRGKGVKLAVLDTGIDKDHVDRGDLQKAVKEKKSFISGQSWDDGNGHGTHCCGIIAADNDQVGTSSILDGCDLYVGKVLSNQGSGGSTGLAAGIDWAVEQGCHVISMSWGGGDSRDIYQALRRAEQQGICCVAAAGNSGRRGVIYPAAHNDVCLSTAAIDFNNRIASFSSVGSPNDFADYGVRVYSTYRNLSYARLSGTSMATPNLAAVIGAIIALEIKILGKPVARRLTDWNAFLNRFVVDLGSPGHDPYYGNGFINFQKMIEDYKEELEGTPEPEPPTPPDFYNIEVKRDIPKGTYKLTPSTES